MTESNPKTDAHALLAALDAQTTPATGVVQLTLIRPEPETILAAMNDKHASRKATDALHAYSISVIRTPARKNAEGQYELGEFQPEPDAKQIREAQKILEKWTDYEKKDVISQEVVEEAFRNMADEALDGHFTMLDGIPDEARALKSFAERHKPRSKADIDSFVSYYNDEPQTGQTSARAK